MITNNIRMIDTARIFQSWVLPVKYKKWFSIHEIESSPLLQWSFGAVLLFYFLTFQNWISGSAITVETARAGRAVCWPYFQECYKWYFFHGLPDGYSQSIFYMALYGVIVAIVYFIWSKQWDIAHALMSVLFVWKTFVVFVLSYTIAGPYDYFHIVYSFIILFLPYKEYFLKVSVVLLYFLSASSKFSPAWVLGTYFSTLQNGLPLFPRFSIPLLTNFVIFMQVVAAWFLLSRRTWMRMLVFTFFVVFHLYSGVLVYYHYPSVSLPLLIILFGPMYTHTRAPFSRKSLAGWIFLGALVVFQLPGYLIPGDQKLTLEGNRFGMFMFEANHQCVQTVKTYRQMHGASVRRSLSRYSCRGQTCLVSRAVYPEGEYAVTEDRYETAAAWNRCDPYVEWVPIKQRCALDHTIVRTAYTFDHSINGGPFYRIVDEQDACTLQYKSFVHNAWITFPPEAPVVGYPVRDDYRY